MGLLQSFMAICTAEKKNVSHLTHMFPDEVEQDDAFPSYSNFLTLNKCPVLSLSSAMFFPIFVLFVGDFGVWNSTWE